MSFCFFHFSATFADFIMQIKLNRKKSPPMRDIAIPALSPPQCYRLDNGIPVYAVHLGTQDILKVEVVFNSGRPDEHRPIAARATAAMLKEGTYSRTSAEIAEHIDFYGGSFSVPTQLDTSNIILCCLTKHFSKLLSLLEDLLHCPSFPQRELDIFIENNIQRLQIELTKNEVLAYRKITELIFGEQHPYGYNSFPDTYSSLTRGDLQKHFDEKFNPDICSIFLSGKISEDTIDQLNAHLGQRKTRSLVQPVLILPQTLMPEKIKIVNSDTTQTAVKIGCRMFNRLHEDYNGMFVLNTVLGGYFGSRLMANIREEKGFTYNIYSSFDTMLHDGYFYVSTEVGNDFVEATREEIYKEMHRLQTEPIGEAELQMLRNYLLGNLLTLVDGPFNIADTIKTLLTENANIEHFHSLGNSIKNIQADELQALAQKYFQPEKMWEVIVGV